MRGVGAGRGGRESGAGKEAKFRNPLLLQEKLSQRPRQAMPLNLVQGDRVGGAL